MSPSAEPWVPQWAVHPGEVIREALEERSMPQSEFAKRMDVSAKHVNLVLQGKSGYSADFAIGMEYVLGISAAFWLNLQAEYRLALLRRKETP